MKSTQTFFKKISWPALWFGLLGVYMLFVNPMHAPVFALIVPFVLLALGVFAAVLAVIKNLNALSFMPQSHRRTVAALISFVAVGSLGLQSIGQFSLRDTLILILLAGIAYLYVARNILGTH